MRFGKGLTLTVLLGPTRPVGQPLAQGGWQEHRIRLGDDRVGRITRPARRQVLRYRDADSPTPIGLARMDDGEHAMPCSQVK
jgi:hypothetical protein